MRTFNIQRLMDASPFTSQISDKTYNALLDFYIEIDVNLDNLNIDNDIINWINECTITEFKEYHKSYDDVTVLVLDEENDFISYFN